MGLWALVTVYVVGVSALQVAGTFHIQLAAFKALEAEAAGQLTSRTLHSELVYCLAGTKHVSPYGCIGSGNTQAAVSLVHLTCSQHFARQVHAVRPS